MLKAGRYQYKLQVAWQIGMTGYHYKYCYLWYMAADRAGNPTAWMVVVVAKQRCVTAASSSVCSVQRWSRMCQEDHVQRHATGAEQGTQTTSGIHDTSTFHSRVLTLDVWLYSFLCQHSPAAVYSAFLAWRLRSYAAYIYRWYFLATGSSHCCCAPSHADMQSFTVIHATSCTITLCCLQTTTNGEVINLHLLRIGCFDLVSG